MTTFNAMAPKDVDGLKLAIHALPRYCHVQDSPEGVNEVFLRQQLAENGSWVLWSDLEAVLLEAELLGTVARHVRRFRHYQTRSSARSKYFMLNPVEHAEGEWGNWRPLRDLSEPSTYVRAHLFDDQNYT